MEEDRQLESLLLTAYPHVRTSPTTLSEQVPGPRAPKIMRTILDDIAKIIYLIPGCSSACVTTADPNLLLVSAPSSDEMKLRCQVQEWIYSLNHALGIASDTDQTRDTFGFTVYSAIYPKWAPVARKGCEELLRNVEQLIKDKTEYITSDMSEISQLRDSLSSLHHALESNTLNKLQYTDIHTTLESLSELTKVVKTIPKVQTRLRDLVVVSKTITFLTKSDEVAQKFPQGLELQWITSPAPRRFEAKLSEDYLRRVDSSRGINWTSAIGKVQTSIQRASEAWNPPHLEIYLADQSYIAECVRPHTEVTLVQYLLENDFNSVDYIACQPEPCWTCCVYAKAVYQVHQRHITLGSCRNARIDLPWVCPPGTSPQLKELLRRRFLWIVEMNTDLLPDDEDEGSDEESGLLGDYDDEEDPEYAPQRVVEEFFSSDEVDEE